VRLRLGGMKIVRDQDWTRETESPSCRLHLVEGVTFSSAKSSDSTKAEETRAQTGSHKESEKLPLKQRRENSSRVR
jgi:hypothetical protein